MDNALLVSLSHQLARQRSMDVIANNLANMNTGAYRREEMKFEEYVHPSKPSEWQKGQQGIDFVIPAGTLRDLSEGSIEPTGNTFDLAIGGKGYFVIQTAQGERYTRNGHFTLNADGQIVTESGEPVLGDGGPLTIANEDGDITIGQDGTVGGEQGQIGRLRVVQFANERQLEKIGDTYYATNQEPVDATDYKLEQGMLERSNVEPITEMTNMINVTRTYQAMSNLISMQESLKRTAISKLSGTSSSS